MWGRLLVARKESLSHSEHLQWGQSHRESHPQLFSKVSGRQLEYLFHEYNQNFKKQDYYRISMALRGMRLIYIAERVHTGVNKFKEYTPFIIDTALAAFNVPKGKRETAIAKAMDIARKDHITIYGINF
jgi:hypothetical protein